MVVITGTGSARWLPWAIHFVTMESTRQGHLAAAGKCGRPQLKSMVASGQSGCGALPCRAVRDSDCHLVQGSAGQWLPSCLLSVGTARISFGLVHGAGFPADVIS